jgi:uncharacterized protein YdeI (YjbR/CyaY-like superfamily)
MRVLSGTLESYTTETVRSCGLAERDRSGKLTVRLRMPLAVPGVGSGRWDEFRVLPFTLAAVGSRPMKGILPKSKLGVIETIAFASPVEWRTWLDANHERTEGVWMRFFKKDSGVASIKYAEALDEALCYGWIDGQMKSLDAKSYLQKFTPRRARSVWSKRNVEHVARLTREERMHAAGLKQVESAKADGRWERAYDSPSAMAMPEDFLAALAKNRKASKLFETLNKSNRYAIAWRLQTAKKAETRQRRLEAIIKMLAAGEKFH